MENSKTFLIDENKISSPDLKEIYERLMIQKLEYQLPLEKCERVEVNKPMKENKCENDGLSSLYVYKAIREEIFFDEENTRSTERDIKRMNVKTKNDDSFFGQISRPSIVSKNSIHILVNNLEKNLNEAFLEINPKGETKLGFLQLGRLLYILGILKNLVYNENFER